MKNYINDFKIETAKELGCFFKDCGDFDYIASGTSEKNTCFVSTSVRRDWILNHQKVTVNGRVYDVEFIDQTGGVYLARIKY